MSPSSRWLFVAFSIMFSLPGIAQVSEPAATKADALLLYRQGRDLESAGKISEAGTLYAQSIEICDTEIAADAKRMDAYAVKCWCLFRLNRHQEVIEIGLVALKNLFDARIAEVMGESYYYQGKNDLALKSFQKYIESGQYSDRVPTAYFYLGETYLRLRKWSHADIAYTTAVKREPGMPRWWYRLGQVCENLGDWQRSADAYAKALSLSPGLAEAAEGLARVKPKIGT
ncbi:MAG: tetratricopeptide repeat protein [Spirochaetota bacterium]